MRAAGLPQLDVRTSRRRGMPLQRLARAAVMLALAAVLGTAAALSGSGTAAQVPADAATDLASVAMGGRVEWVTSEITQPDWAAWNLIADTPHPGWGGGPSLPQEVVFSFFNRQSALVAGVAINPKTPDAGRGVGSAKDVEIWTSPRSPTEGFTRVAAAELKDEDIEQRITFEPVEAAFVKVRVLSAQPFLVNGEPTPVPAVMRRVRIFEGRRAGYVPLLDRHKDLAAVTRGQLPRAPETARGPAIPPEGPACTVTAEATAPKRSRFPSSRRVLVVAHGADHYLPGTFKATRTELSPEHARTDYSIYDRATFTWVTPAAAVPALLLPALQIDTVVLAYLCDIDETVSPAFKQALVAWVAAGHKLILQDSDTCGAASGPKRSPDYGFLPYPFASSNPGAAGMKGTAHLLESSTLASSDSNDTSYLDVDAWVKERDGNSQEFGDANLIVRYDPHWCGVIFARNAETKNGFALAYAKYGKGLIIYDGIDRDDVGGPVYDRMVTRQLAQPFDPDYLTCSQRLADFVIATESDLKSRHIAPGQNYTYPVTVFGNNAYSGTVALTAKVIPADPSIGLKVEPASVRLGELAAAKVTVTTSAATSVASKVVELRGRDAAGKQSVLCLDLPERRSGSLAVVSALRADRKPSKNLEIILDASGSMRAMLGKKTRWATAQEVLADVVSKLPADYQVGLRVYGHREASTSPNTCTDTELVVPVEPLDRARLLAAAKALRPRGETPLVHSTLQTPADLEAVGGGSVILITDGEESCRGDFAAAAAALKGSGLDLTLNIVGFTLKSVQAQADLRGLAQSTGGRYYHADSGSALSRALLLAAVDRLPYRVLDAKGTEVAKGTAGVSPSHELPPGDYKVVVSAGEETLTVPVSITLRQDVAVRVGIKDDKLVVE